MTTKLATTQIRLAQWADIIKDRISSGQTVLDYCREHGLSRDAYFYWLRKVRAAALEQSGFVELQKPLRKEDNQSSFETQLMIKSGGLSVCVNNNTPPELLAKVLGVIHYAE